VPKSDFGGLPSSRLLATLAVKWLNELHLLLRNMQTMEIFSKKEMPKAGKQNSKS
jgi:hypothetical protein